MKIAIIGTHSTGKTTLIEKMRAVLLEHAITTAVVPEMARLCPFPINEDSTVQAQTWILENQIAAEEQTNHRNSILICDRASIDNWAYFSRALSRSGCVIKNNTWEQKAVAHARSYDYIFKTHMLELPAEKDGQRATDQQFRQEMDNLITAILRDHDVPYHSLPATLEYDTHIAYIMERLLPIFVNQQSASAALDSHSIHLR